MADWAVYLPGGAVEYVKGLDERSARASFRSAHGVRRVPPGTRFVRVQDAVAPTGYEAECQKCGETFNPDGPDDLEHLRRADDEECGGKGVLRGWWG